MSWLRRLLIRPKPPAEGDEYRIVALLYNAVGSRSAEVRLFDSGQTYIVERETIEGVLVERHNGAMVGPFASPQKAERFITSTDWFNEGVPHRPRPADPPS